MPGREAFSRALTRGGCAPSAAGDERPQQGARSLGFAMTGGDGDGPLLWWERSSPVLCVLLIGIVLRDLRDVSRT